MNKFALLSTAFAAGILSATAGASAKKPNIVLVLADDLGWGDIGYNGGQAATPNLDQISSEGIRFDRFYAQAICTPSRAALMTGRYPWRMGMASGVILDWLDFGLPLDETTLAQEIKSSGYATYIVGKWHLGHKTAAYLPTSRGFDYHYGLYVAIDHFTHEWGGALDWHRNGNPVREKGYDIDLLGNDCVRIIKEHDYDTSPLFLYHATFAVHAWNQAPEKYTAPYADVKDSERRQLLGMVAALDYQFGQIVQALKQAGQLDNTLIFFASDNGGDLERKENNGPLRGGKGTYYEGGLRVPAFAYWPGKIKGGRTTEALVHITDLFPTFVHLTGAEPPAKPIDGFDLGPILFNEADTTGRTEIPFIIEDSERLRRGAIIDWPLKLRRTAPPNGPWVYELFNIEKDPYEKENAYLSAKSHPEITDRLSRRLDELNKTAPPAFWKPDDGKMPEGWKYPTAIGPPQEQK